MKRSLHFRTTIHGLIFIVFTLLIGVKATMSNNNFLLLLFAAMVGIIFSTAWLTFWSPMKLGVRRRVPEGAYADESMKYAVDLHNRGRHWPLCFLSIHDELVHDSDLSKPSGPPPVEIDLITPGEELRIDMWLSPTRRGPSTISRTTITCVLPMDLFRATRRVGVESKILIYPQRLSLHRPLSLPFLSPSAHANLSPSAHSAENEEFACLREYRIGDSPRDIYWKGACRTPNQLLVKQYETPRQRNATILLDTSVSLLDMPSRRPWFERGICFTLAAIECLMQQNYRLRFVAFGPEFIDLELWPSRHDLNRIRGTLAALKPAPDKSFGDLCARSESNHDGNRIALLLTEQIEDHWERDQRTVFFTPSQMKSMTLPTAK